MSANLWVVPDDTVAVPEWTRRWCFDFRPPRAGAPCPACGEPIDPDEDCRRISFAAVGGQRLCEDCLHAQVPEALIAVAEAAGDVLAAVSDLDGLRPVDRLVVRWSATALADWLGRTLRERYGEPPAPPP